MALSQIKAVVFDAVGTTLMPEPGIPAAYAAAGQQFGSQLTLPEIRDRFDRAFARQEAIDAAAGQITSEQRERERWETIVSEVFAEMASPDLFTLLWDYFADPAAWRTFDDVADCWRQLEQYGYRLCVASNFDSRLASVCQGLPPLDGCQDVFVSSLLGARKPGKAFFEAVQAQLRLPPEQILMVGDGRHNDYLAARAAGWPAVLVQREGDTRGVPQDGGLPAGSAEGSEPASPDYPAPGWIIRSLRELPRLLSTASSV
jgi:putative hydrolase of the HAD superfamily